jgi:hypothetical protein
VKTTKSVEKKKREMSIIKGKNSLSKNEQLKDSGGTVKKTIGKVK